MKKILKAFNVRIDKDLWLFLKQTSIRREMSMNEIISECIQKYKTKSEGAVERWKKNVDEE